MTTAALANDRNRRLIAPSLAPLRWLAEFPVQQLLGERHALELEELNLLFHPSIEREADLPRPREHLRILDGGFVHQVIRADGRVALDDVERVAVKIPGAIEPRLAAQAGHVDDER